MVFPPTRDVKHNRRNPVVATTGYTPGTCGPLVRPARAPLAQSRECSLADVFVALAEATGEKEVHLFAHWMPAAETLEALGARGIGLVVHPVEAIERAALVEERCFRRWQGSRLTRVA